MNEPKPLPAQTAEIKLHAQYLRDLSFESPGAPQSLTTARAQQPRVDMRLDLRSRILGESETGDKLYELVIRILLRAHAGGDANPAGGDGKNESEASSAPAVTSPVTSPVTPAEDGEGTEAREGETKLFVLELEYAAAIVPPQSLSPEQAEEVLMTEGAHIIFPYARKLVADITQEGGFQPVILNPLDFRALYQMRKRQEAQARGANPPTDAEPVPNGRG